MAAEGVESNPRGAEDDGAEREQRTRPCCVRVVSGDGTYGWCVLWSGHVDNGLPHLAYLSPPSPPSTFSKGQVGLFSKEPR